MSQQVNLFNPIFRPKAFSFTSAKAMLYAMGIAATCLALADRKSTRLNSSHT